MNKINMIKNRLLFGAVLAVTVVFIFFYGGKVPYALFYTAVGLIVASLLYLLITILLCDVHCSLDRLDVVKGGDVVLTVEVRNNSPLFIPYVNIAFKRLVAFEYEMRDESLSVSAYSGKRARIAMNAKYRGRYDVNIADVRLMDFLGIVNIPVKFQKLPHVLVYPNVCELDEFTAVGKFDLDNQMNPDNISEDITAVSDVRQYKSGDGMRRIHWNLSARMLAFMSKNYENITKSRLTMLLNLTCVDSADAASRSGSASASGSASKSNAASSSGSASGGGAVSDVGSGSASGSGLKSSADSKSNAASASGSGLKSGSASISSAASVSGSGLKSGAASKSSRMSGSKPRPGSSSRSRVAAALATTGPGYEQKLKLEDKMIEAAVSIVFHFLNRFWNVTLCYYEHEYYTYNLSDASMFGMAYDHLAFVEFSSVYDIARIVENVSQETAGDRLNLCVITQEVTNELLDRVIRYAELGSRIAMLYICKSKFGLEKEDWYKAITKSAVSLFVVDYESNLRDALAAS